MTWTYTNDPSTVTRDRVRFLIHDTDTTHQLITDEEIAWSLSDAGNDYYRAAATCCRSIAASLRGADMVIVGDVSEKGTASKDWLGLADEYDRKGGLISSCPSPFAGGLSRSRRKDNQSDTDRTSPRFWFGQFDNPPAIVNSTLFNSTRC